MPAGRQNRKQIFLQSASQRFRDRFLQIIRYAVLTPGGQPENHESSQQRGRQRHVRRALVAVVLMLRKPAVQPEAPGGCEEKRSSQNRPHHDWRAHQLPAHRPHRLWGRSSGHRQSPPEPTAEPNAEQGGLRNGHQSLLSVVVTRWTLL